MIKKKVSLKKIFLICVCIFFYTFTIQGQTNKCECQQIKPLLTTLSKRVGGENKAISKLFQIGDKCINDIIFNLNGKDFQMSVAAQEIIRYLGNEKGLIALETWNKNNSKSYPVWGPVPTPIMDFDYEMIEANLLGDSQRYLGLLTSKYFYALAIDKNSPKSKLLFQRILRNLEADNEETITRRIADHFKNNYPLKSFLSTKNIENSVLDNAFFLSEEDKKFTNAKLLSFNENKDKALIELHLSRGLLAEEWHHVVIKKIENNWEFFSITFIKQS